ncbi:uncharacterized protein [Amphiura filiformis]|uniref:uncharacterized protein n=1 Tax=Amphiura filiformis TaxID=82378 RepID=UPI003B20D09D
MGPRYFVFFVVVCIMTETSANTLNRAKRACMMDPTCNGGPALTEGNPVCSSTQPCTTDGRVCVDGTCQCPVGFTGATCAEESVLCDPNPCTNGVGQCSEGSELYTCNCPAGYSGPKCEDVVEAEGKAGKTKK